MPAAHRRSVTDDWGAGHGPAASEGWRYLEESRN